MSAYLKFAVEITEHKKNGNWREFGALQMGDLWSHVRSTNGQKRSWDVWDGVSSGIYGRRTVSQRSCLSTGGGHIRAYRKRVNKKLWRLKTGYVWHFCIFACSALLSIMTMTNGGYGFYENTQAFVSAFGRIRKVDSSTFADVENLRRYCFDFAGQLCLIGLFGLTDDAPFGCYDEWIAAIALD
jgi:hypothetical protein